ncbi:ubiquitin-protein ligase peroxin 12 [Boothiomyces sp. JEL0866]|nr:ubiquitin-protein ligase peroxin 12 [Boothiomyces sp. JEL0866]
MDFLSHLDGTSAVGQDDPSVFEIIANEKMNSLLLPSFEYILTQLTQQYYFLLPLHRRRKLLYCLLMMCIEFSYLKRYGGSVTENFYGLKRQRNGKLGRTLMILSLVELVFAPVYKTYLDEYYNQLLLQRQPKTRFQKLFVNIYPYLHLATNSWSLILKTMYVYQVSKMHSPWQIVTGLGTARINMQDYQEIDRMDAERKQEFQQSMARTAGMQRLYLILKYVSLKLFNYFSFVLPSGIFMFRFLEWWQTSNPKKQVLPIPPPPRITNEEMELGKCRICKRSFVNPAMLNSIVYCYTCIHAYVEEHSKCPLTKGKAVSTDIRKIYDD